MCARTEVHGCIYAVYDRPAKSKEENANGNSKYNSGKYQNGAKP